MNYLARIIVNCVEPTEPYGEISVKGLSESKLYVRVERSHVTSRKKGIVSVRCHSLGGTLPGILIRGTNPF